jgi:hypothetical protein
MPARVLESDPQVAREIARILDDERDSQESLGSYGEVLLSQPKNRFEQHPILTISLTILFVLGFIDLVSLGLLQIDVLESKSRSLELADYKRYDAWTLFQNRPDQTMRFNFKGIVENAEFGLDSYGFVTTANQPTSAQESILILGGSTVFGVGASSYRTTIASRLQALLNEHAPGKYIVHNGGVRGFSSLQEFVYYVNDVRTQIAPSIVISLNGRNDDHLMRKALDRGTFDTDYSNQLEQSVSSMMEDGFEPSFLDALSGVAKATHIGQLIKSVLSLNPQEFANPLERIRDFGLPPDDALFREPANNYTVVMNALFAAVATEGGRHIWALQPTVFDKPFTTDEEKVRIEEITKIPPDMYEIHRLYHESFYDVARQQAPLDLSSIFETEKRTIYLDDCHYNDLGNEVIAEHLLEAVLGGLDGAPGRT